MVIIHQFEKKKVLIYATAWMKLENMLNERIKSEKNNICNYFIYIKGEENSIWGAYFIY